MTRWPDRTYAHTRSEVESAIRQALPAHADRLIGEMQPGIRFVESHGLGDRQPAVRLGGGARLPLHIDWPRVGDRPLHLMAVIDLGQVAPFDATSSLLASGFVYVFFDGLAGLFLEPPASFVIGVTYEEAAAAPERFRPAYPVDDEYTVRAVFAVTYLLEPWTQWTFPRNDESCVDDVDWYSAYDDDANRPYWRRMGELNDVVPVRFQILGWPHPLSSYNMSHHIREVAAQRFGDEVSHDRADWRLLFQLTWWDDGFDWGDEMIVAFMIPHADLLVGRYDRVLAYMEAD